MSYIAVDLKVIEGLAGQVARSAGTSEDRILAGLVRLWHRCWATTTDIVSRAQLAGVMGGESLEAVAEALVQLDFLEVVEGGWRVRGAQRYLRLKAARKAGAEKTNAARSRASLRCRSRAQTSDAQATLPDALTPSTEHRAPSTKKRRQDEPAEVVALREAWNELTTAPIAKWTAGRTKTAQEALKRRSLEQWREVFTRINATPFLRGEKPGSNWKADIDWALRAEGKKPESALKVLEGAFDDNGPSQLRLQPQGPACVGCGGPGVTGWPELGVPTCHPCAGEAVRWSEDNHLVPYVDGATEWLKSRKAAA